MRRENAHHPDTIPFKMHVVQFNLCETQHDGEEDVNTKKLEVEVEELVRRKVKDTDPSANHTEQNQTQDRVDLLSPLRFFCIFVTFTFS